MAAKIIINLSFDQHRVFSYFVKKIEKRTPFFWLSESLFLNTSFSMNQHCRHCFLCMKNKNVTF